MLYNMEYDCFNQRRYGNPWVAKIKSFLGKPELEFVPRAYSANRGDEGELVFEAEIGEVVKIGQKDNRGGNTQNSFYLCQKDGDLLILDAIEARKKWLEWKKID